MKRKIIKYILFFLGISGCVDPFNLDVPVGSNPLFVEGFISDDPGPYQVMVSRAFNLTADSAIRVPVTDASIWLYSDRGEKEQLHEVNPGVYQSSSVIRGQVGNSYHIELTTSDGRKITSSPETISPGGEISEIRTDFEPRVRVEPYGEVNADVLNVVIDGVVPQKSYARWKLTGTYKAVTYPELHQTYNPPYTPYKNPFPCSGYILVGGPEGSGGILQQVGPCECCTCWANDYEQIPQTSDSELVVDGNFRNVKVGEVQITSERFYEKYLIQVEQMSLSKTAFDFFTLIKKQKVENSSIFQPSLGRIVGNVRSNDVEVVGLFWATSITRSTKYVTTKDLPYPLTPFDFSTLPCYSFYPNSTAVQPKIWE
jgi:Domain of unknown function (DUF4249)